MDSVRSPKRLAMKMSVARVAELQSMEEVLTTVLVVEVVERKPDSRSIGEGQ